MTQHSSTDLVCSRNQTEIKDVPLRMKDIDFKMLLLHFREVQVSVREYKKKLRIKEISSVHKGDAYYLDL